MLKTKSTPGDTSWFVQDRFGLFIHWGLYSQAARHEWVMNNESIPVEEYEKRYFKRFDPDLYDPKVWAKAASDAGMKYFVVTTKHHDGFCLWDTKQTDYKATNTAAGRDLIKPMVKAFRDENMKVGLYHSIIDWHHPNYVIDDRYGPYRLLPEAERKKMNARRKQELYAKYLHAQVRELLTQFGKVDVLWCDFSYPSPEGKPGPEYGKGRDDWQSEKLYKMIRKLMPKVVLNDRLDLPSGGWDIKTPEQFQPREWVKIDGVPVVWEACQTFSGSWGYYRDEMTWKSNEQLLQMLIDTVSKGGNLLLNVGPTGRGEFDERALSRLSAFGEWMRRHSRSIYGCTAAPPEFKCPQDCRLTYNPKTKRMYVHVFAWPFVHLFLDGFKGKVEYAQLLNDASEVQAKGLEPWQLAHWSIDGENLLTLNLPVNKPNVTVPVIELFMK